MTLNLNPTPGNPPTGYDQYPTQTLGQLRQMIYDALGFIPQIKTPTNLTRQLGPITPIETSPVSLTTDIRRRLGIAQGVGMVADTLVNLQNDLTNALGLGAMASNLPANVLPLLNTFINEAQQTLYKSIEFDAPTAGTFGTAFAAPAYIGPSSAGTTAITMDRTAVLQLAIGLAKAHYGQDDAELYIAQSKKYLADLLQRGPPNITQIIQNALIDAQRVIARRPEMQYYFAQNADNFTLALANFANPLDYTSFDAEPILLLALANLKMMLKHDDAKTIMDQFERMMAEYERRLPPDAITYVNRKLQQAQDYLYRTYKLFRMERWYTWTTQANQNFYGITADDGASLSPPTGVTAVAGNSAGHGMMTVARQTEATVLLQDGRVFVIGGSDGTSSLSTTEIFDPATNEFTATADMNVRRNSPSAIVLDDGTVLICSGSNNVVLTSAELYDPVADTMTVLPDMVASRAFPTLTKLSDGTVLIVGGNDVNGDPQNTAEIYYPLLQQFVATGSLTDARAAHAAALLPNGAVLVCGGYGAFGAKLDSAEVYYQTGPNAGTWVATGSMVTGRGAHAATALTNGQVLITGGKIFVGDAPTELCELYSHATGVFASTGSMNNARVNHSAVPIAVIDHGTFVYYSTVLVCGGDGTKKAEIYNIPAGTWSYTTGDMPNQVTQQTGWFINNSYVLIVGGSDDANATRNAMLYNVFTKVFVSPGSFTYGTVYYRVAAQTQEGTVINGGIVTTVSPGTTLPSDEVSVVINDQDTPVTISWTPLDNTYVTGYAIYGRSMGAEELIAVVDNTESSYVDNGTIIPSGALPTANTTGNLGTLDPREIIWVGASNGENTWRELIRGIPPQVYNSNTNGPPQFYDIRQAMEIWPPPRDDTWLIRIKGYFSPRSFSADTDQCSIDWQPIYYKALADCQVHYRKPEEAKETYAELTKYIGDLVAGAHGTRRYIPSDGKEIRNAVRPVALTYIS